MTTTPQRSPYHRRLKDFQLGVATKWIDVAASERTSIFQFVAYFAAFNALYWLWGEVDGRPPSEKERITNLVGKLNPLIPDDEQVKACIRNLRERGPIRDMR